MNKKSNLKAFRITDAHQDMIALAQSMTGTNESDIMRRALDVGLQKLLLLDVSPQVRSAYVKGQLEKVEALHAQICSVKQEMEPLQTRLNELQMQLELTKSEIQIFMEER